MKANPRNLFIIQVYVQTADCSEEELEMLYDQLEATIVKIPKKDIKAIQGDWNSKIGTEAHPDRAGRTGKFGGEITNERGIRLFARTH